MRRRTGAGGFKIDHADAGSVGHHSAEVHREPEKARTGRSRKRDHGIPIRLDDQDAVLEATALAECVQLCSSDTVCRSIWNVW